MFIPIPREITTNKHISHDYFNAAFIRLLSYETYGKQYEQLFANLHIERIHAHTIERFYTTETFWNTVLQSITQHTEHWIHLPPNEHQKRYLIINPESVVAIKTEYDPIATNGLIACMIFEYNNGTTFERFYDDKNTFEQDVNRITQY